MLNVVIADDDAKVRKGLQKVIEWEKLDAKPVMITTNGRTVAEFVSEHPVDLIISDVKMPIMNGVELSKYIYETHPDITIVLLSAYAEFEFVQEAMRYNVLEYILKPIDFKKVETLTNIIKQAAIAKKCKTRLYHLIHNINFRNSVKKAFESENVNFINNALTHSEKLPNLSSVKEYYVFLFDILNEFLSDIGYLEKHTFNIPDELQKCCCVAEYNNLLLEKYSDALRFKQESNKPQKGQLVQYVKKYIDETYSQVGISTDSVSAHFNLSIPYLSQIFKDSEGITLVEYVTRKKMDKAIKLICTTALPIRHIALSTGYENVRYFARVFKSYTNMSPAEYRANANNCDDHH